jgi:hypothetical protein
LFYQKENIKNLNVFVSARPYRGNSGGACFDQRKKEIACGGRSGKVLPARLLRIKNGLAAVLVLD